MAKKSTQGKSVIKYLLFTVIVLLVTVSLLSLFVYRYTNLVSDSVLGASTVNINKTVLLQNLTCGMCAKPNKNMVIVLQKTGTNSREWGARCVAPENLNSLSYIAYIICPAVVVPSPRPTERPMPVVSPHPEHVLH